MKNTTETDTIELINRAVATSQSYHEYRKMVTQYAAEGKTTGPEQSDSYIEYTQLNNRRMNRWDKTLKFSEEVSQKIRAVDSQLIFLVLTESWCGDAAPSVPVMNKIAELNPNIELRVALRDKNLELTDEFLTNGARSIPKLILINKETNEVLGDWGPRPEPASQLVQEYKAKHGKLTPEFRQDLQVWYNKDKGQNIAAELGALLALK
ncbi:thioredoxin family protein [Croceivirga thetidis]|nr:thioredoxin family protein [Croceivirga thetidis]